jgi:hypothetical protein
VSNHVIYDRIWESKKLAACSRNAAFAYPWIYLVADDWGRFEYLPRVIWGKVFGQREDVKAAEVKDWLDEYVRVGLLEKYEVDGLVVCQWTRFVGPPPSKRRAATLPAPSGAIETEGLKGKSRFHNAPQKREAGSVKLEAGSRKPETGSGNVRAERAEEQAPQNGNGAATPPARAAAAIDHDPNDPNQVELAERCASIAERMAEREEREATAEDVIDVLYAVSGTPEGKHLDSLRKASPAWMARTLRACNDFEIDNELEPRDRSP